MTTISDILHENKSIIDALDVELILADSLGKSREFVLSHPEYEIPKLKIEKCKLKITRRTKGEPLAYILGHKEFYGLDFTVNEHTLVPRPETELLVDLALEELRNMLRNKIRTNAAVFDVGTGSGNIIVSIAKDIENYEFRTINFKLFGIDISEDALKIAKRNAKLHNVDKKINFLNGNILDPILKNKNYKLKNRDLVITANLPYLSDDIYQSAPRDVKNFEPKSALYSPEAGLQHYRKLLEQLRPMHVTCHASHVTCFLEISPEQKKLLKKIVADIFPKAKIKFFKDLSGKWRVCKIKL